ncbi:MAG: SMC-Scp complex subunit ScpB [Blastocatellia bacterium]|nr:SMC-Scp complex subunit ScpB [Blastocatellia bacterium]
MIEDNQEYEEAATPAEDSPTRQEGDDQSEAQSDEGFDEQALAEILAEDQLIEDEFLLSDIEGDPEDNENGEDEAAEKIKSVASESSSEPVMESLNGTSEDSSGAGDDEIKATRDELKPVIEALLFVADEPLPFKQLCKILGNVPEEDVMWALSELVADYERRGSGLEAREIAGGWRISTRPQYHEFIRKYLKSRPSARLSLPALETLAVIAYKQPITIPEILEIRGVTSSSAVKTLLEKRLIVTKGRKETVGRPMMYGTSKEFLIQFGLKDLSELPSIEDFEDLAQ